MKTRLLAISCIAVIVCGCASGGPTSESMVATGGAMGVAGAAGGSVVGGVGLVARGTDWIMSFGKPRIGKLSPGVMEINNNSPRPVFNQGGKVVRWEMQRVKKDGVITEYRQEDVTEKRLDEKAFVVTVRDRFLTGDFGEDNDIERQQNMDAWRDGGLLVATYKGKDGFTLVAVSRDREPAELMLLEEWTARKDK